MRVEDNGKRDLNTIASATIRAIFQQNADTNKYERYYAPRVTSGEITEIYGV